MARIIIFPLTNPVFFPSSQTRNAQTSVYRFPVDQISEAEVAERGQVAVELSATRDDQMRLCAADVEARIERDNKGSTLETTIAGVHLADSRRLHRICTTRLTEA